MAMKRILKTVKDKLGITSYKLSTLTGISESLLSAWSIKNPVGVSLKLLAALRKVSGLSWNQFGKIIDEEISDD